MSMPSGTPWLARLLFAAAGLLVPVAIVLAVTDGAGATVWINIGAAIAYLGIGLLGLLLTAQSRRNPTGWVLLVAALGATTLPVIDLLAPLARGGGAIATAALNSLAATSLFGLFTLGVLLFPDGRGHGRLGRALVPVACVVLLVLAIGSAGSAVSPTALPLLGETVSEVADVLMLSGLLLTLPVTVLAAVTATGRRRTTTDSRRRGLRLLEIAAWVNAGAFLACGALAAMGDLPGWFGAIADQTGVVFAVAAWIGILRFRLVDLRATLAHTLPYVVASAAVVVIAALTSATLGTIAVGWLGGSVGALVAALVALLLREQLQELANLIVYGRRVDPATERTRQLEQALRDSHRLLITARDDERRRIRRDLHDGLGPTLAGLVLGVENVERHLDDPVRTRAELARLHQVGQGAVQEVRQIVYALHPPALDSLGLAEAIREQANRLGAASIDVRDLPELPESLEIGVYLIALEAMKNAATHARPGPFEVRLGATERLRLEVQDAGPGLPVDYTPGIGIGSMRERAAELGGTLDIRPLRPRGTLVSAEWALI